MTDRISKISTGTVGSMPCEILLNDLLIELNDVKITNLVMKHYQSTIRMIKKSKVLLDSDVNFYETIINILRKNAFQNWENYKDKVPEKIFSVMNCCLTAQYRGAIRLIKKKYYENP